MKHDNYIRLKQEERQEYLDKSAMDRAYARAQKIQNIKEAKKKRLEEAQIHFDKVYAEKVYTRKVLFEKVKKINLNIPFLIGGKHWSNITPGIYSRINGI